jgi:hypothetical protein
MSNPDLKVLAVEDVVEAIGIISEGRLMDRDEARTTLSDLGLQVASPTLVRINNMRLKHSLNSVARTWMGAVVAAAKTPFSFTLKINDAAEESTVRTVPVALTYPDRPVTPGAVEEIVHDTITRGYYSDAVKDLVRRGVVDIAYAHATGSETLGSLFEQGVHVVVNVYSFSITTTGTPDSLVLRFDAIPSENRTKQATLDGIIDVCLEVLVQAVNATSGPLLSDLTRVMETVSLYDPPRAVRVQVVWGRLERHSFWTRGPSLSVEENCWRGVCLGEAADCGNVNSSTLPFIGIGKGNG